MTSDELHPRVRLLLSVQRALLGAVPPSLRLVTCDLVSSEIRLCFVLDGPIRPEEEDRIRDAATEVIADFPAPYTIDDRVIRVDFPNPLDDYPHELRVYERMEPSSA